MSPDGPADLSALSGAATLGGDLAKVVATVGPAEIVPGWATVEIERALGLGRRSEPDRRDGLLGAAAAVLTTSGGRPVVLLEPTTEGPLAAALARHGEGWLVAYLLPLSADAAGRLDEAGYRLSAAGLGPFGEQRRLLLGRRDGPFILLVDRPVTAPRG
jgi:hypothetical protein